MCLNFFFLIIKPTRCTNFSNLFLEWNSTCFGQFLCPSSEVFHRTHSNGYMSYRLWWQLSSRIRMFHPDPARKPSAKLYDIYPLLCLRWKTSDDGQKNCPKHVEFHSKNKFEKLVHLVGFIISVLKHYGEQVLIIIWCTAENLELKGAPWRSD
jgi:hypothetical protein